MQTTTQSLQNTLYIHTTKITYNLYLQSIHAWTKSNKRPILKSQPEQPKHPKLYLYSKSPPQSNGAQGDSQDTKLSQGQHFSFHHTMTYCIHNKYLKSTKTVNLTSIIYICMTEQWYFQHTQSTFLARHKKLHSTTTNTLHTSKHTNMSHRHTSNTLPVHQTNTSKSTFNQHIIDNLSTVSYLSSTQTNHNSSYLT